MTKATSPYLNRQPRTYLEARAARLATKFAAERARSIAAAKRENSK